MPGLFRDTGQPLGGLLGQPQQPAAPKMSFLDKLLGLYGAGSQEQLEAQRRKALVQAGLAMMQASGPSPVRMPLAQIAGAGLQAGMAGGQAEAQKQRLSALAGRGPEELQAMIMEAVAYGDYDAAGVLANLYRSKQAGQASKARGLVIEKIMPDGTVHNILIDPTDGREIADYGEKQPDKGVVVDRFDPRTGSTYQALVHPRTGKDIAPLGMKKGPKEPTAAEEQMATRAKLVAMAVDDVNTAIEKLDRGPTFLEWNAYKNDVARAFVPNDVQGLLQAEEALVSHLAFIVTGSVRAAASQPIRDAIFRSYLVAPGDSPLNREQTLRNLRVISERLKTQAGRAWLREEAGITDEMIEQAENEAGEVTLDESDEREPLDYTYFLDEEDEDEEY